MSAPIDPPASDGRPRADDDDRDLRAVYAGVFVFEAVVIAAIWLFGAYFKF